MSLTLDMKNIIKKTKEDTLDVIHGTLFGVSSRIIKGTPVGNPSLWMSKPPKGYVGGSLRGAWSATINAPDMTPKMSIDSSGGGTINEALATIGNVKVGDTFYLSNALPYAERVEFGWSTQRPNGMVRKAVADTQRILDAQ